MKNLEVNEFMHRYLDNDLSEDEAELLMEHLKQSPASAAMFERLKRLNADLEQLPKVTPPISIVDSILPQLESEGMTTITPAAAIDNREFVRQSEQGTGIRRSGRERSRSVYTWTGGVVAAGIAITLFITNIMPEGMGSHSADNAIMENIAFSTSNEADSSGNSALRMEKSDPPSEAAKEAKVMPMGDMAVSDQRGDGSGVTGSDPAGPAAEEAPSMRQIEQQDQGITVHDGAGVPSVTSGYAKPLPSESLDTDAGSPVNEGSVNAFESANPLAFVSPDETYAAIVTPVNNGIVIVITDTKSGVAVHQTEPFTGEFIGIVWNTDSQGLMFEYSADNVVTRIQVDLTSKTETVINE